MISNKTRIPTVGLRIVKSSITVLLCYLLQFLPGTHIVFYCQLAGLWCIQPYTDSTLRYALQRVVGTSIGAFYGLLAILLLYEALPPHHWIINAIVISLMIIPVLYTSVCLRQKNASFFSCVVFLSIVVLHLDDVSPFLFVWQRFFDTVIGIVIGISVNAFHLPRRRRRDLLFVSGLDETLLTRKEKLSDYSTIELNQMLSKGLRSTISTRRTPAALLEMGQQIHLNLPVIAMDGAVLYDIQERKYLRANVISYEKTMELATFIRMHGFHCFLNAIVDDTLMIYHQTLRNPAELDLYKRMYSNPNRNYISMELPEHTACIYLMLLDETEKVDAFYIKLMEAGYTKTLKIVYYPSDSYAGYSYLKIYSQTAKRENMLQYLLEESGCQHAVTFGSIPDQYDYTVSLDTPDKVVHLIKKQFEPLWLPWHRKSSRHL